MSSHRKPYHPTPGAAPHTATANITPSASAPLLTKIRAVQGIIMDAVCNHLNCWQLSPRETDISNSPSHLKHSIFIQIHFSGLDHGGPVIEKKIVKAVAQQLLSVRRC